MDDEKRKAILKIEEKIKFYDEHEAEDDIDINLFYPLFDTKEKREHPEIYGENLMLTLRDMIFSEYLTRDFCDWCFNVNEWNYECGAGGREDNINFFNCIPPMLLDSKYQNITKLTITHTKITKIEYIPSKVTLLDLCCNQIEKIENIPNSVNYLDLESNRIKKIENLPINLFTLRIHDNQIKKLENLPNKLTSITFDINQIIEYGDLSNLENKITIYLRSNNDIFKIPIINLKLNLEYYPKGYREIQYINNINIQSYYFKKWHQIILNKKERKKYDYLLSLENNEISKLSNLLFYILVRRNNDIFTNIDDKPYYKSKEDLIIKKIEKFKNEYLNGKKEALNYIMNELCEYIGEQVRPIYHKRIIISSESNKFLKKKINFKRKICFSEDQLRNTFDCETKERKLIDYFLDKTNVSKNNNYAEFLKTKEDNILIYPFITNKNKLLNFNNESISDIDIDIDIDLNLFD